MVFATIFGLVQYLRYQGSERLNRTLDLLRAYDKDRHIGMSGVELTAAKALGFVQAASTNMGDFMAGHADFMAGRETPLAQRYLLASDAAVIAVNYFNNAGRLAKRKSIDKNLFLEAQAYSMTLMFGAAIQLLEAEGRRYDHRDLEAFVNEAREYLRANPAVRP